MNRFATTLLVMMACAMPLRSHAADGAPRQPAHRWFAGAFSFSDELGGFSLRSVTGSGTREDPIRIVQELVTATPVTLVIRALGPAGSFTTTRLTDRNVIYVALETANASGIPWVEFEFELQKEFQAPSVFGDGLSFDQIGYDPDGVSSDRFLRFHDNYEPYDRLRFSDGFVDPRSVV